MYVWTKGIKGRKEHGIVRSNSCSSILILLMATSLLSVTQKRNDNPKPNTEDISGFAASDVSFCTSEDVLVVKGKKPKPLYFQYVNPALLLEW